MYSKIVNPYDKKKINIKSKLGKKILQNYLELLGGSSSMPWKGYKAAKKGKKNVLIDKPKQSILGNPLPPCKKGKEDKLLCPDEIYRCNIKDEAGNTKCVDRRGNTLLENLKIEKKLYPNPNPFQNKLDKIPPVKEKKKNIENCKITVPKCPEGSYKFGSSEDLSSFQNIRNLIKNLEINDKNVPQINYNGKKYKYMGLNPMIRTLRGSFGNIEEQFFSTGSESVTIVQKISNSDRVLDELSLPDEYTKILYEECPNIVPFKIIKNNYFMIRADGTLKGIRFSIKGAEKIIMCLVDTLLCLRNRNIYYFDLKPENIGYICIDNEMSIFLIDLGSMLPITTGKNLGYLSTYPHPIFNSHYLNYEDSSSSNYVNIKMLPVSLHIYSYQLSALFFELIGINTGLGWKMINTREPSIVKSKICAVLIAARRSHKDNQILKKYYDVYEDIDNQLEKFEKIYKNFSDKDQLQLELMNKPNIVTNLSSQLFKEAKEIEPAFFSIILST